MIINKQEAEAQLVGLQTAVTTGKIAVRVTDTSDPAQPIEGALVTITDGTTIIGTTDANGEVTLEVSFSGMDLFATKTVRVAATRDGFTPSAEVPVTVIAVATIDVNLVLIPQ